MTFPHAPPSWSPDVLSDLVQLLELPEGWNSYHARRVEFDAVKYAIEVLFGSADRHTPRPSIVPTARGGVQVEWHGENDIEIEVLPSGRIEFLFGDQETEFDSFTEAIPEIRRELREIAR